MRVHLDLGSALQCQRVHLDHRSALRCISVHCDHGSGLGCMRLVGFAVHSDDSSALSDIAVHYR